MADEQGEPRQDVHDASSDDRLRGILVQVAADRELSPELDAKAALADRLSDQGIELDSAELDRLAATLPGTPSDDSGPFLQ